jgi:fructosamine-3-kinase
VPGGPPGGGESARGPDEGGLPERVAGLVGTSVRRAERLGSAVTGSTWRLTLDDGRALFGKHQPGAADGFIAAETAGLRWLAEAPGGPPVPEVVAADAEVLLLPWLDPGRPTPAAAERLGRRLAALHAAGAGSYGAPWPGWIGAAPLDNRPPAVAAHDSAPGADGPRHPAGAGDWAVFYAERRVRPYVRMLVDGGLAADAAAVLDRLCDRLPELGLPAEPVARIHGDLWSGNVFWAGDGQAWLIDPAAHGGHRETDLAMLALFGAPGLDRLLGAYQEVAPLAPGWPHRLRLHQLHPLLVHAVLFGGRYLAQSLQVASSYAG